MTKKRHQGIISLSLPKVATIAILTLVAILTIDFGRKALDSYHVQRQVEMLRQQIAVEEEKNEALQDRLEYVSSDAYVEKIARETLGMIKPGDSVVVVIPTSTERQLDDTRPGATAEATEEEAKPYWQRWRDLLLGSGS